MQGCFISTLALLSSTEVTYYVEMIDYAVPFDKFLNNECLNESKTNVGLSVALLGLW